MRTFCRTALLALALVLVLPAGAFASGGGVEAGQPFPTNLYTVRDRRRRRACASTCPRRIAW